MARLAKLATLVVLFVVWGCLFSSSFGASLSVVQSIDRLWNDVATNAAQATLKALRAQSGVDVTLTDVPMDSFQVYVGRQHQLGIEIDGVQYEVILGSDLDLEKEKKALPGSKLDSGPSSSGSFGLVPRDYMQERELSFELPEVTLSGPMELVLQQSGPISLYTPLAVDVGSIRRLLVAQGVTVTVQGLRSISLRRPVDLPSLPAQYLAEAYAHAKLGEPEPGFERSPGILYLATKLRGMAVNSSLPLLSFEVVPAFPGGLVVMSSPQFYHEAAPRLKVKKLKDGTVELTMRPDQVSTGPPNLAALAHTWAWPLPHVDLSQWVPYESLLRGMITAMPFKIDKINKKGIPLRLTKSNIKGVSLVHFDMVVTRPLPGDQEGAKVVLEDVGEG